MNKLKQYLPLITIIVLSILAAGALSFHEEADMRRSMHIFMGVFLLQFAMLKFFDIKGFAKGFARYDLLAKKFKPYGLIYPFIELTLALGYLASAANWVYLTTIIVMGFGALGVVTALLKGLNINCACLGTFLKIPLSIVAITENVSMAIMAVVLYGGFRS